MSRLTLLLTALLFLLATPPAGADSWMAPQPRLVSSADGRHYVCLLLEGVSREARVVLVRRAAGRAPRPTTPTEPGGAAVDVSVDAGDTELASATGSVPMELRCLSRGAGWVAFENWGGVGYGVVAARYDADGKRCWAVRLRDLFEAAVVESFPHSVSSIWWYRGIVLDEDRGDLVVVAHENRIVRIALPSGAPRQGSAEELLDLIGKGTSEEQALVLDTVAALQPKGAVAAAQQAFGRGDLDAAVRLRLAVILARAGDDAGRALLLGATARGQDARLREYAVRHLPAVLGARALPALREAMRGEADEAWSAAQQAFVELGVASVDTLASMVRETGESNDYRGGAAHALGSIGPRARPAVEALLQAAEHGPEYTANASLNALVRILPPAELRPQLLPLLVRGSHDDGRIALYLVEHPRRDAIPALEAALQRHAEDAEPAIRGWLREALQACRAAPARER